MNYGLTLAGVSFPGGDPLGLCRISPIALSFEAAAPPDPEVPMWRDTLPASPDEAKSFLAEQRTVIYQRQTTLERAYHDLQFLTRLEAGRAYAVSLSTHYPQQLAKLQTDLLQYLSTAESFGLFAPALDTLLAQEWHTFISQVERIIAHCARLESSMDGWGTIGRTVVTWSGDFHTTWQENIPRIVRLIHLESVQVSLASRMLLVHTAAIIVGGATGLALKASTLPPGGQILLLPYVWRFVRDVLAELDTAA